MEENCAIVGLNENEVELELGLSIGGSFKRVEKLKPVKKDPNRNRVPESGPREKAQPLVAVEQECAAAVDPQRKREIQAMRRQEAKKKQEEKQQKRGLNRGQNAEFRSRESEEQPEYKRKKVDFSGSSDGETKNPNLNSGGGAKNPSHNVGSNPPICSMIPVHVPCPYPYPQVQYGFVYPCGTSAATPPCWGGGGSGNERNVGQQAVTQGFRSFKGGQNQGSGFESDPNSSRDERNRKSGSNGSPVCSSSVVSDLQSSSNQGGCSSDIGTHSSNGCQPECHPQMKGSSSATASNVPKGQLEETATSHQTDSGRSTNDISIQLKGAVPTNAADFKPNEGPMSPSNSNGDKPAVKDETTNVESTSKAPPAGCTSLPYMPCVSTTGKGPNGRTVHGFLYRYSSQAEVSIVCVCHGSSFSPAEFVQHAGGTDVSHPLRHITVIPSAF